MTWSEITEQNSPDSPRLHFRFAVRFAGRGIAFAGFLASQNLLVCELPVFLMCGGRENNSANTTCVAGWHQYTFASFAVEERSIELGWRGHLEKS